VEGYTEAFGHAVVPDLETAHIRTMAPEVNDDGRG